MKAAVAFIFLFLSSPACVAGFFIDGSYGIAHLDQDYNSSHFESVWSLSAGYRVGHHVISFEYLDFGSTNFTTLVQDNSRSPPYNIEIKANSESYMLWYDHLFPVFRHLSLTGGLGAGSIDSNVRVDIEDWVDINLTLDELESRRESQWTAGLRGGIIVPIGDNIELFSSVRYQRYLIEIDCYEKEQHPWSVTAGARWLF